MLTQPAPVNPSSHSVKMNGLASGPSSYFRAALNWYVAPGSISSSSLACGPENVFSRSVTARLLDPPKDSSESRARDAPTSRPTSAVSVVQPSKPFSKSPAGRRLSPGPTTTSDTSPILKTGMLGGSGQSEEK